MRALVCLLVLVLGCTSMAEEAEEEARHYAQQQGWEVRNLTCENIDKDGNGYAVCTFLLIDGSIRQKECAGSHVIGFQQGCRDLSKEQLR